MRKGKGPGLGVHKHFLLSEQGVLEERKESKPAKSLISSRSTKKGGGGSGAVAKRGGANLKTTAHGLDTLLVKLKKKRLRSRLRVLLAERKQIQYHKGEKYPGTVLRPSLPANRNGVKKSYHHLLTMGAVRIERRTPPHYKGKG